MIKQVYKTMYVELVDGTEIYLTPLKIKYLREFLEVFDKLQKCETEDERMNVLIRCMCIAMKQYYPKIKTVEDVEDNFDVPTIYNVLDIAAGISFKESSEEMVEKKKSNESTIDELDIVEIESEVFLLGIWKDFEDLETSLCMEELIVILNSKRDSEYNEKKFAAAMQGVDLDKQSGKSSANAFEDIKARAFSRGKAKDSRDILSLQGITAQQAGFGIGNGLSYEQW